MSAVAARARRNEKAIFVQARLAVQVTCKSTRVSSLLLAIEDRVLVSASDASADTDMDTTSLWTLFPPPFFFGANLCQLSLFLRRLYVLGRRHGRRGSSAQRGKRCRSSKSVSNLDCLLHFSFLLTTLRASPSGCRSASRLECRLAFARQ